MRRIWMALAAAVASALVMIAVAALDAVGADKGDKGAANSDLDRALTACMRDHGVAIPDLRGAALDRWFKTNPPPDAIARTCKAAVAGLVEKQGPPPDEQKRATAGDVRQLVGCLRSRGLDPPTDPIALKTWIVSHRGPAIDDALKRCDVGPAPACGDAGGASGKEPASKNRDASGGM